MEKEVIAALIASGVALLIAIINFAKDWQLRKGDEKLRDQEVQIRKQELNQNRQIEILQEELLHIRRTLESFNEVKDELEWYKRYEIALCNLINDGEVFEQKKTKPSGEKYQNPVTEQKNNCGER